MDINKWMKDNPELEQKIMDIALAPQAGILKIKAVPKFFSTLAKMKGGTGGNIKRGATHVQEILSAPQKELSRIKDVIPTRNMLYSGLYKPYSKEIKLSMSFPAQMGVFWHELAHARQFLPEGGLEGLRSKSIRSLRNKLFDLLEKQGVSLEDARYLLDPIERHAIKVEKSMTKMRHPARSVKQVSEKHFSRVYKPLLKEELEYGERVYDLLSKGNVSPNYLAYLISKSDKGSEPAKRVLIDMLGK